jgi:trehalose/maltose hydrolase-like predicted phosphorylase
MKQRSIRRMQFAIQIHIVGDIALSMWQYYAATHNTTWLRQHGLPVLTATAEFFAAWAQPNGDGSFSLNATQGPDEFHTGNDSCYVNAAAALNLRSAANFSRALGVKPGANWTQIADNVRIPFDTEREMHPEFAGWTDAMKAKQADTIMLSYPLGLEMPKQVRQNDLDYYANHTGNGPSMTWSMFAVGYIELGDMDAAATFFNRSWLPYVDRKTGDFGGDCGGCPPTLSPLAPLAPLAPL